jgi:hypothetical protein
MITPALQKHAGQQIAYCVSKLKRFYTTLQNTIVSSLFRNIDGRTFSSMSETDFAQMVGYDPGNLLW